MMDDVRGFTRRTSTDVPSRAFDVPNQRKPGLGFSALRKNTERIAVLKFQLLVFRIIQIGFAGGGADMIAPINFEKVQARMASDR